MSITRIDELTTHLGLSSPPARAQATLDIAEALVASYLSIEFNRRGDALQEHTVSQRVTPVRNRKTLEVTGGPVTAIESITYNRKGFRPTGDEVAHNAPTSEITETFDYVFNPDFSGWIVSGRNADGSPYVFNAGEEYLVTYRTGWCAGTSAYNWQFYRNSGGPNSFTDAHRLGWEFAGGGHTGSNDAGDLIFGSTSVEGINYETGVVASDGLKSPALSFSGKAFPFVVVRSSIERASTTGFPNLTMAWRDGDGRTYHTGKKTESRSLGYLPDRARAFTMQPNHLGYRTEAIDMGFLFAGFLDEQLESINRSWIDADVIEIQLGLWTGGASYPNGAKFNLDYIRICDGTVRMPEPVKTAVLETARHISSGGGSGIQSESIGDYSKTLAPGEAFYSIPPTARILLNSYRRPSW